MVCYVGNNLETIINTEYGEYCIQIENYFCQIERLEASINTQLFMLGDNRELEPPDPIPNSEVKRLIADGSVGLPHVRVGHRQALIMKKP